MISARIVPSFVSGAAAFIETLPAVPARGDTVRFFAPARGPSEGMESRVEAVKRIDFEPGSNSVTVVLAADADSDLIEVRFDPLDAEGYTRFLTSVPRQGDSVEVAFLDDFGRHKNRFETVDRVVWSLEGHVVVRLVG